MRSRLVWIHRYVGLAMALFLAMAGLTGSLLVWYHELDAAVNPRWFSVTPAPGAAPIDPLTLRERVEAAYPHARVNYVSLSGHPQEAAVFHLDARPRPDKPQAAPASVDEVFVNPYTAEILGARRWGALLDGWHNLMPFIYRLHYALALDDFGVLLMGVVALLWTLDCFAGAWLTFPPPTKRGARKNASSWLARWKPAWKLRWREGSYKLNYDLHRAGGLWPWLMLLVLAWSGVAFNLNKEVYSPTMRLAFDMQPQVWELPARASAAPDLVMPWQQARLAGQQHMQALASREGFEVAGAEALQFVPRVNAFRYRAKTSRDVNEKRGNTYVVFDAVDGRLLMAYVPTGKAAGDTLTTWLMTLHMAHIWGIPFRMFVTVLGVAVAMLSITGIHIWLKKRAGRRKALNRDQPLKLAPGQG